MKIKVDDKEIFELTEVRKKVICNDIPAEEIDADLERRLQYILQHKYERCMERLRKEWSEKLKGKLPALPTDDDEFAQLVFSQPDYKDRSAKIKEEKELEKNRK